MAFDGEIALIRNYLTDLEFDLSGGYPKVEELQPRFRTLSRKYHPDMATPDAARFLKVNEAYNVLANRRYAIMYKAIRDIYQNLAGTISPEAEVDRFILRWVDKLEKADGLCTQILAEGPFGSQATFQFFRELCEDLRGPRADNEDDPKARSLIRRVRTANEFSTLFDEFLAAGTSVLEVQVLVREYSLYPFEQRLRTATTYFGAAAQSPK